MARDFNGSTDRIDYGNIFDPSSNANGWTWAGWVFPDDVNRANAQYFWTSQIGANTNVASLFFISGNSIGSGSLTATVQRATTATSRTSDGADISAGAWGHVAATWSGGTLANTLNIYVNGVALSGWNSETNGSGAVLAGTGTHCLGGRTFDDNRNLNGRMAHCGLWDVALTTGDIAMLVGGFSPASVRPANLVYGWPLIRSQQDVVGGQAGTLDGTTVIREPRVVMTYA
jgi:hypothetical protein